eukprot:SAG22_NODE_16360_length_327_cov_0.605263_1_plen_44_part_00
MYAKRVQVIPAAQTKKGSTLTIGTVVNHDKFLQIMMDVCNVTA